MSEEQKALTIFLSKEKKCQCRKRRTIPDPIFSKLRIQFIFTSFFIYNLSLIGPNTMSNQYLDSLINAFIPSEWEKHYEVAHFEVDSCPYMYKTTEHTFVIRFIAQTALHQVINDGPVINLQYFLHILANTNLELPGSFWPTEHKYIFTNSHPVPQCSLSTKIRHISLKISSAYCIPFTIIYRNVEVYLSLLDEAAARFKGLLNSGESTNSVMVVTSLNPQKKEDLPSLNAETDLPSLNAETVITTKELSSTGDLSKFLSNSSSQSLITQEAYFTCIAQIVEVVAQKGWYYVSCTHCVKEVGNSATSHP
ncbi:hypothetical protein YC2023_041967 [Brassica napus]